MRFMHIAAIIVSALTIFSYNNCSCSVLDPLRIGFRTTFEFVKDIPNRIPKPSDVLGIPFDSYNLEDVGKSAADVAQGFAEKIPSISIPKPDEIFEMGKNLLVGYPFEQVRYI